MMEIFWETFRTIYAKPAFDFNIALMMVFTITSKHPNSLGASIDTEFVRSRPFKIFLVCIGALFILSNHGIQVGGLVILTGIVAFLVYQIIVTLQTAEDEIITSEIWLKGFFAGGLTFVLILTLVSCTTTLISAS